MSAPGYKAVAVEADIIKNRFGYMKRVPLDSYTVVDGAGQPIRTHDGFAIFPSHQQAAWCAELMGHAFFMGEASVKAAMRNLLDIPEPPEDED